MSVWSLSTVSTVWERMTRFAKHCNLFDWKAKLFNNWLQRCGWMENAQGYKPTCILHVFGEKAQFPSCCSTCPTDSQPACPAYSVQGCKSQIWDDLSAVCWISAVSCGELWILMITLKISTFVCLDIWYFLFLSYFSRFRLDLE